MKTTWDEDFFKSTTLNEHGNLIKAGRPKVNDEDEDEDGKKKKKKEDEELMAKAPGAGERRLGNPRTDNERLKRHFGKNSKNHSTKDLPPRGTGLKNG